MIESSALVSLDPGKRACGVALWVRAGERFALEQAELVQSKYEGDDLGLAVQLMAGVVGAWLERSNPMSDCSTIAELPRTYRGMADKGDANTLIALGAVVGATIVELGCPSTLVSPHDWKGNIPKKTEGAVNIVKERSLAALSADECARIKLPIPSLEHNVFDAVGLGLWWLKKKRLR